MNTDYEGNFNATFDLNSWNVLINGEVTVFKHGSFRVFHQIIWGSEDINKYECT